MERTYYELHVDWNKDGAFSCEFGDFDRDVVKQELEDMKDSYSLPRRCFRIMQVAYKG